MVVPRSRRGVQRLRRSRGRTSPSRRTRCCRSTPLNGNGVLYGMHPSMAGVRDLFESARCAVMANVGPLIAPTTKAQYQARVRAAAAAALLAQRPAGPVAQPARARPSRRRAGPGASPTCCEPGVGPAAGAQRLAVRATRCSRPAQVATPVHHGRRRGDDVHGLRHHRHRRSRARRRSRTSSNASYGTVYERAFARRAAACGAVRGPRQRCAGRARRRSTTVFPANSPLATQLQTVAKMIAVRERLGMSRQVFFVATGGFDTHDDQLRTSRACSAT